jgi:3-hydroxy acid dehydrogenase/malonic semialdehyde reductase
MAMTRAVLPGMVARDRGHVVNIGSTAGRWPYPGANVYGATKAFVDQFSLNLRADLLGTKVRVTVIDPGMVGGTEFSNVRFHGDDARAAQVYERTDPLTADDHPARPRQHQHYRADAGRAGLRRPVGVTDLTPPPRPGVVPD